MILNFLDLRAGSTVYGTSQDGAVPLTVAALFSPAKSSEIFGLVGRSVHDLAVGTPVSVNTPLGSQIVGHLEPVGEALPTGETLSALFAIIRFAPTVADKLKSRADDAAVSTGLKWNIFNRGPMRIRKLGGREIRSGNSVMRGPSASGFLMGAVTQAVVNVRGEDLRLERATLAKGKGGRDFAKEGEGGAPVISASGALMGFIVGRSDERTLVVPAEDVAKRMDVTFLTLRPWEHQSAPSIRSKDAAMHGEESSAAAG